MCIVLFAGVLCNLLCISLSWKTVLVFISVGIMCLIKLWLLSCHLQLSTQKLRHPNFLILPLNSSRPFICLHSYGLHHLSQQLSHNNKISSQRKQFQKDKQEQFIVFQGCLFCTCMKSLMSTLAGGYTLTATCTTVQRLMESTEAAKMSWPTLCFHHSKPCHSAPGKCK